MPLDTNHCRFSGQVISIQKIKTKSNVPMTIVYLNCFRERLKIIFFNDLAENAIDLILPNSRCEVEGKLQTNSYTDRDGIDRYGVQIVASFFRHEDEEISCDEEEFPTFHYDNEQEGSKSQPPPSQEYSEGPF